MKKAVFSPLISFLVLFSLPVLATAQTFDSAWTKDLPLLSDKQQLENIRRTLKLSPDLDESESVEKTLRAIEIALNKQRKLNSQSLDLAKAELARGGVDSGGGSIIKLKNGNHRLLDFYVAPKDGADTDLTGIPPIAIKKSRALKAWGIDSLETSSLEHSQIIHGKINLWESSSPFTTRLIRQALKKLPVYVLDYDLDLRDENFYLPKSISSSNIESILTGAIYYKGFGVFISKKIFDQLSFEDQVGLIAHESLRHLQMTYGIRLSNKNLQKLTVALLRGPQAGQSLDSEEYLDEFFLDAYLLEVEREVVMAKSLLQVCSSFIKIFNKPCPLQEIDAPSISMLLREFKAAKVDSNLSPKLRHLAEMNERALDSLIGYRQEHPSLFNSTAEIDVDLSIKKKTGFNFLDLIIQDFNRTGWTPRRFEANIILQSLTDAKIIRRP